MMKWQPRKKVSAGTVRPAPSALPWPRRELPPPLGAAGGARPRLPVPAEGPRRAVRGVRARGPCGAAARTLFRGAWQCVLWIFFEGKTQQSEWAVPPLCGSDPLLLAAVDY